MLLDWRNMEFPTTVWWTFFDGNGDTLPPKMLWLDTENGKHEFVVVDDEMNASVCGGRLQTREMTATLPISVEFTTKHPDPDSLQEIEAYAHTRILGRTINRHADNYRQRQRKLS